MLTPISQARQVGLLRLLLLALALAALIVATDQRQVELAPGSIEALRWLLVGVSGVSAILVATVGWARWPWQLALHLVFDLLWIGLFIFGTGGVASPAVVLVANLVLPGTAPFVMPALAALVMAGNASLYLAGHTPFPDAYLVSSPHLAATNRTLGHLALQVGGLFLVDLLGQLLTRRLREQRHFTGGLLDQLGEGVLAVDRTGVVAYVNAEAARLLAIPDGAQGRAVRAVLADPRLALPLALLLGPVPVLERWDGDGHRRLVLRVTELRGRGGAVLGRTLLIADETRLRILEEDASQAEHLAALGGMAAGIAHEVRNPLTSLRGCAQELAEIAGRSGQADAAALATIMVGEADRLERIVGDFLALSRLRRPNRSGVEPSPIMADLTVLVRARQDLPAGLALAFTVAPDCPRVFADPDQLRQVLGNLIGNAIDALLHVPVPRLACRVAPAPEDNPLGEPAVLIEVADNGCGIPPELHARVFTPFFSTKAKGTGLGLSLVSRIVAEHDGHLELVSTPGQGTTVRIHLPVHSQTREYRRALGRA
jgi:signal transduction histidine kinase